MVRKLVLMMFVALLPLLGVPMAWGADGSALQVTSKNLDFFTAYCPVMSVDFQKQQMVVCEKVVKLVSQRVGDNELKTMLRDASGNKVPFSRVKKGESVFVRGFLQEDGTVVARGIYLLPANLSTAALNSYSFVRKTPDWEPEAITAK